MKNSSTKRAAVLLAIVVVVAIFLSAIWHVPYIFTVIGYSAWVFFGHLITADDDSPGGWSNPDGTLPFPWLELTIKGVAFLALCLAASFFSILRHFGGAP
jgi:hypothetical protein